MTLKNVINFKNLKPELKSGYMNIGVFTFFYLITQPIEFMCI